MDPVAYALANAIPATAETPPVITEIGKPAPLKRVSGSTVFGEISGLIYAWYGAKVQSLDPVAGTWTDKLATATDLSDSRAFGVLGGKLVAAHYGSTSTFNDAVASYDPVANTTATNTASGSGTSRDSTTAGAVTSLGLHAAGGRSGTYTTKVSTHKTYSAYGGVWTTKAALPQVLFTSNGSAAATSDTLYLINPNDNGDVNTWDIFVYSVASNTWTVETNVIPTSTPSIQAWTNAAGDLFYAPVDNSRTVYQRPAGSSTFDKQITLPALGAIDPAFGSSYPSNTYHVFGTPNWNIAQQTNSSVGSTVSGYPVYKFTAIAPIKAKLKNLLAYLAAK